MEDLASAREQLEKAVARLETVLAVQPKADDGAALGQALEQARREYRNLREVTDVVSGRIDTIFSRLRATLEQDTAHDA